MKDVQKYLVPAAMTIATVLIGVYVLRKAPVISGVTAPLVNKALNG